MVSFASAVTLETNLTVSTRNSILSVISGIQYSRGTASTVVGVNMAVEVGIDMNTHPVAQSVITQRRNDSRLIVVLFSDGNSPDAWRMISSTAL